MKRYRWTFHSLSIVMLTMVALGGVQAKTKAKTTTPPSHQIQLPTPTLPDEPLTVDEAVAFSLRYNPSITLNQQNVQIAQDQVGVARSNRLPSIDLSSTPTYMPDPQVEGASSVGASYRIGAKAVVTQPVWPTSRWRAPISSAEANVGLNQETLRRTQQQVAYQTRQAYYQLLTAQELLQVAQYSVTVAQTQLNLANATFAAGTAPRLDVEQARATLANADVSLTQAQNNVDLARTSLATQIGVPAGTPITIVTKAGLPGVPPSVDPLVAQALIDRPEMAQLNFRRQQFRANIDQIKLQQKLLVDAQGAYADTLAGTGATSIDGFSFGANIGLNVYNGGKTKSQLAAAYTQLAQVDTNQRQLELSITQEVRQAWLNLQNAMKQLVSAQQQQVAADEALRISELRYQNGEGILLEVEQARLNSTQARTTLAQARNQAQNAAAQLEYSIGAPVPTAAPGA